VWSRDLTVEVGGHGVVSHTGCAALRLLADRTGLTGCVVEGVSPPRVHPRARPRPERADTAVLIADGGRVLSDLAVLRDQGELFGPLFNSAKVPTTRYRYRGAAIPAAWPIPG
jgi:hypothetical protein